MAPAPAPPDAGPDADLREEGLVVVQLTGCPRELRRRTLRLIAMLRNLRAGDAGGGVRAASDDESLAKQFPACL
jgi:hypothetical protein